jgi:DNA repair protein RecO (recombination protein O)
MDWQDEGIVLAARGHGESDAIVSLFTFEHGRHTGLVRGGGGRRLRPLLQPGNRLGCTWRARLSEHLGRFAVEPLRLFAATVLDDPPALAALGAVCGLLEAGTGERDPHPSLYAGAVTLLERLARRDPDWPADYVRFELLLLAEAGFGLDLRHCALTGVEDDLAFVSPRSGRAVSRAAGAPWAAKLLPLPAFLTGGGAADAAQIVQGLKLAGWFLYRHILAPADRTMPPARERLFEMMRRQAGEGENP